MGLIRTGNLVPFALDVSAPPAAQQAGVAVRPSGAAAALQVA